MTIVLDSYIIPEKGMVELKVDRAFEIKVTAEEARRRVNRWLHDEVSMLMRALSPSLVVGEQIVWRVPASLGMPHLGQVGTVGTVDVDVTTGEMTNTSECKAELERCAKALANRLPPYQPRKKTPPEYVAKNVPPAPNLHIPEDEQAPLVISEE